MTSAKQAYEATMAVRARFAAEEAERIRKATDSLFATYMATIEACIRKTISMGKTDVEIEIEPPDCLTPGLEGADKVRQALCARLVEACGKEGYAVRMRPTNLYLSWEPSLGPEDGWTD